MSIQWTFIAGFLYLEVAVVIVMISPMVSPRRWNQFFKSRLFSMFKSNAATYFYVILGVLCLFLFDAIREMRKYSHSGEGPNIHLTSELKGNIKLFRAQRNFYITGFAIFLSFVIRRLFGMIILQHELTQRSDEITKEAEATMILAQNRMLANAMESHELKYFQNLDTQLHYTKILLQEEKKRAHELERQVQMWEQKYEAIILDKGDH